LFLPRGDGQDMLAAPGGVGLMIFKVRAGAGPAFAFLPDEIQVGRMVDGIHAKAVLRPRNNQRSVSGVVGQFEFPVDFT